MVYPYVSANNPTALESRMQAVGPIAQLVGARLPATAFASSSPVFVGLGVPNTWVGTANSPDEIAGSVIVNIEVGTANTGVASTEAATVRSPRVVPTFSRLLG